MSVGASPYENRSLECPIFRISPIPAFGPRLQVIKTHDQIFHSLDIEFVSLSEQVDTSTPTGKMVFTVLGAVAELERSLIVERVKAGMRNARAKGKRIGRPPRTFLNSEMREAIARAYRRREGSLRELASRFHTSVGAVQRCIRVYQTGAPESLTPSFAGLLTAA